MTKRYALVGTGGRAPMFLEPIATTYRDVARIAAFCDTSPTRMAHHTRTLATEHGYTDPIAHYTADRFDELLRNERPDTVLICSVDATHADYIIRSIRAGADVVVEKPLAISAEQCRAIQSAVRETGRSVRVAFNYRWVPGATRVWELLREGSIGTVQHVHFEYLLNTRHGADYFRRWHAHLATSGGLLVHKATHHFDLVNWWLDAIPDTVFANGRLAFYGKENAIRRGDAHLTTYPRYLDSGATDDPFHLDMRLYGREGLYLEAEADSGYIRDRNVFRDDIDIFDTMSVAATYRDQTMLTYSLVAYAPYEGYRVSFTGDRGRLEYAEMHASHLILGQSGKELARQQAELPEGVEPFSLTLLPHFREAQKIEVATAEGSHGGGDPLLQEQLFSLNPRADHARRVAGWEQGIASVLMGIGANHSIASGQRVALGDLVSLRPEAQRLSELI